MKLRPPKPIIPRRVISHPEGFYVVDSKYRPIRYDREQEWFVPTKTIDEAIVKLKWNKSLAAKLAEAGSFDRYWRESIELYTYKKVPFIGSEYHSKTSEFLTRIGILVEHILASELRNDLIDEDTI